MCAYTGRDARSPNLSVLNISRLARPGGPCFCFLKYFCFRRSVVSQSARLVKRRKISLKTPTSCIAHAIFSFLPYLQFHYSLDKPLCAL